MSSVCLSVCGPAKSRNPHAKKAKSNTGDEIHCNTPKANYRNPPALDGVCLRMAVLRCHVQSSTLHSERRHTSKSIYAWRLMQPGRLKWTLKHSVQFEMQNLCRRKASNVWMVLLWCSEASCHKVWPACYWCRLTTYHERYMYSALKNQYKIP